jgi:hypothetical protein
MATSKHVAPDPLTTPFSFEPIFALTTAFAANLAQLQRLQLDAWLSWQKSLADSGQELFDEWSCRFGGGVPIDG